MIKLSSEAQNFLLVAVCVGVFAAALVVGYLVSRREDR